MSTSNHIDKICICAIGLVLILTLVFMGGGNLTIVSAAQNMKYESTLFDTSYVHEIDIVMDDWDSFIETCENEEYSLCTVIIDGKAHKNVAIRAKGNTSLSNVSSMGSQRYSFKLEFDHNEDGNSCDGLDKLCLNNLIQDNTMMKDYIVYTMMKDFKVDSPLCSFTFIKVNDEDWGLYLAVEGVEDSFLSRNYGVDGGELYKPDSEGFGGGRGNGKDFIMDSLNFKDFNAQADYKTEANIQEAPQESNENNSNNIGQNPNKGNQQLWDQSYSEKTINENGKSDIPHMPDKTFEYGEFPGMSNGDDNKDSNKGSNDVKLQYIDDNPSSYANIFNNAKTTISSSDEKRLISALKNLSEYTDLESTLNIDEVLRYFVVHNFVVNGDSYTGNMIHNYYLHEKNGMLSMIPWDYNLAFGTFQGGSSANAINDSIDKVLSDRPMQAWIFSSEVYTEQYHTLFSEFIKRWFTNGELQKMISNTAQMLRPYVEKDPTKFCTTEEFDTGVKTMENFVTLRAEAVSYQLDGNNTPIETNNINLSDMGSMGKGFGEKEENRNENNLISNKKLRNVNGENIIDKEEFNVQNFSVPTKLVVLGISALVLIFGLIIAYRVK